MRPIGVAVTLVMLAACGSSSSPSTTPTSPVPSSAPSSPTAGSPAASPSVTPSTSIPPSGSLATSSPAPLGTSAGGNVTLSRTCVHRGDATEQQSVTVRASPGETVTYATYYSDYSSALNRPDYTTGQGYGQAGPDGRYRATWTVPAGATPGRATVRVTATDWTEDAQDASFIVVKQGERCP